MQINKRQDDLMVVFDKTWKANHNDDVKNIRKNEKDFMDKMFNVKKPIDSSKELSKPLSQLDKLNQMNNNMNSMNSFNNNNRINSLKGKFN